MWSLSKLSFLLFSLHFLMLSNVPYIESKKLVRLFNNSITAAFIFGDSTVDSGNNNYVPTPFRSNFPPYGREFANHVATGRFTDGRLVTDYIASYVGIKENIPPYLDPSLGVEEMMSGVCFASAGSGFDPTTDHIGGVIAVPNQLEYFKEYKSKLIAAIGEERTRTVISKAVFLISAGTNDFVVNYYAAPFRRQTYNITGYQDFLLQNVRQLIEGLRNEGARMITVVGLPPMGCLPIVITIFGRGLFGPRSCTDSISLVAVDYNRKLQSMLKAMQTPTSPLVYADIYKPLSNMIKNPSHYGFDHVNVGCCGSGFLETSFLCNHGSQICSNPSKYVFFDSVHPTEATYYQLFKALRPTVDLIVKKHGL